MCLFERSLTCTQFEGVMPQMLKREEIDVDRGARCAHSLVTDGNPGQTMLRIVLHASGRGVRINVPGRFLQIMISFILNANGFGVCGGWLCRCVFGGGWSGALCGPV